MVQDLHVVPPRGELLVSVHLILTNSQPKLDDER